jgi:anti-sigma factor RsiW
MDKNCGLSNKINAWLDGELSREESEMLQLHLTNCTACQKELLGLKKVNSLLGNYKVKTVPDQVSKSLIDIPGKLRTSAFYRLPKFSRLAVAASIAIAFFAGVIYADLASKTRATLDYASEDNTFYSYFEGVE